MGRIPRKLKPFAEKLSKYNKAKRRRLRSNVVTRFLVALLSAIAGIGTVYVIVVSLMGRFQEFWNTMPSRCNSAVDPVSALEQQISQLARKKKVA